MNKLKPVIFTQGKYDYYRQDTFKQDLLLQALTVTSDPIKLRQMLGLRSVAEVYRTLDKLSIRKEYHQALQDLGMTPDAIVKGIKTICETAESDAVRLSGYKTLLQSLGLDKYDKQEEVGTNWEETLLKLSDKEKESGDTTIYDEYEVIIPETPIKERIRQTKEQETGKQLYA